MMAKRRRARRVRRNPDNTTTVLLVAGGAIAAGLAVYFLTKTEKKAEAPKPVTPVTPVTPVLPAVPGIPADCQTKASVLMSIAAERAKALPNCKASVDAAALCDALKVKFDAAVLDVQKSCPGLDLTKIPGIPGLTA